MVICIRLPFLVYKQKSPFFTEKSKPEGIWHGICIEFFRRLAVGGPSVRQNRTPACIAGGRPWSSRPRKGPHLACFID
jgi:hypothetical protein